MTDFFAGALLALCICLYGSSKTARLREKHKQEDGFLSLLEYIKLSVASGGRPLYDIFDTFHDDALDKCGFLTALRHRGTNNAISYAIDKCDNRLLLDKGFLLKLDSFSDVLCMARNRVQAKELCEKYISELEDDVLRRRKKEKSFGDLYLKLSPLAALSVFLLFL